MQATKLALMHVVDWGEAQQADAVLAAFRKWLKACKDTPFQERDTLLKKYLDSQVDTDEGHALFCMCNNLVLSKGLLHISTMPKEEVEGVLPMVFTKTWTTRASKEHFWCKNISDSQ